MDVQLFLLVGLIVWSLYAYQAAQEEKRKTERFCFLGLAGDCGSTQTTVDEIVNNSISNTFVSNASSCSGSGGIKQTLDIENIQAGGNIDISGGSQTGTVALNFSCLQNNNISQDSVQEIQNAIKQGIQQKTSGFQFQPSTQTTISKTENDIVSNINLSQVADCVANSFADQEQIYRNLSAKGNITLSNLAQTAVNDSTSKCVQEQKAASQNIKALDTIFDQQVSQEAKGVDIIALFQGWFNMIQSFGAMGTLLLALPILCCCCICLASIFSSSGGGSAPTPTMVAPSAPAPTLGAPSAPSAPVPTLGAPSAPPLYTMPKGYV